MNAALKAIFKEKGCELPTEEPPAKYSIAENPISLNSDFSTFDTSSLYLAAGDFGDNKTKDDKYLHIRQYYLNQNKTTSRNQLIEDHLNKIKNTLTNGSLEDIKELYRQRHIWRQKAHEIRKDEHPICLIEDCINIAVPGSSYCINHIVKDPNQKLFAECTICKRPYPVCSSCFTCRDNPQ